MASLLGMTAGTQEVFLMDKKEICEKLKNSLDMVNVTFWLTVAGIVALVEGVMLLFAPGRSYGMNRWLVFGLMALISTAPILIFCA